MNATLLHSLLLTTLAMTFVLLARRPLRQLFGARPAFMLWLLPPLLAVLPWLPALPVQWATLPTMPVFAGNIDGATAALHHTSRMAWLESAWLAGATVCLLRLFVQLVRLHRQSHHLPAAMLSALLQELQTLDSSRLRLHPAGPALLPSAPRTLLLLPADFLQRFSATERQLILRHELTHLRRGDALWNLLAELAAAALWFHPLIWFALPRFRLDQELACDEHLLCHAPQDEADYAHVLMHSAGHPAAPTLIPWLSEPQLKERLTMIQRHRPGALRRRIGYLGLAALMAGSTLVAQASTKPAPDQSAESDLTFNSNLQPSYPAAALKNHEEGTVILLVQVHMDGTVGSITYDPQHSTTKSADLIAAASNAARQWRFNPQTKNGVAVEGYARVPVKFALSPLPAKPQNSQGEKSNSKS
ncbi:M56 family metallopeptidase [Rhodanobacter sp. AS-Z3]|uniref:M56 family metallopeptidase n=1 Tax=Rhodanobacter sp. AS-Z3 TaxID=3031330 RepID=UPI0024784CAE|nr:M56 family metallopeptidase [Rhodanobacter sp. AS-Z3]WEN16612.1 M56 family metallopeptidase [Rhodanobacter sp. AS-Z3]